MPRILRSWKLLTLIILTTIVVTGVGSLFAVTPTASLSCGYVAYPKVRCTGSASPSGNYRAFYLFSDGGGWFTLSPDGAGPWTFTFVCKEGSQYPTFDVNFRVCVLPGLSPESNIASWTCNPSLRPPESEGSSR